MGSEKGGIEKKYFFSGPGKVDGRLLTENSLLVHYCFAGNQLTPVDSHPKDQELANRKTKNPVFTATDDCG